MVRGHRPGARIGKLGRSGATCPTHEQQPGRSYGQLLFPGHATSVASVQEKPQVWIGGACVCECACVCNTFFLSCWLTLVKQNQNPGQTEEKMPQPRLQPPGRQLTPLHSTSLLNNPALIK